MTRLIVLPHHTQTPGKELSQAIFPGVSFAILNLSSWFTWGETGTPEQLVIELLERFYLSVFSGLADS